MAGGKIRGISIEISGDTTSLDKALTGVNKQSRDLQSELKKVESGLKFNPGNAELIKQKQGLLADAVVNTTKKLDSLKAAQQEVETKFKSGEIDAKAYRDFRREVLKTENQLDGLRASARDLDVKVAVKADTTGIDKVKNALKEVGPAAKAAAKEASAQLATISAAGVAGVGATVIGSTEMNTDLAKLRTNALLAGKDIGVVEEAFREVAIVSGETDSAVETVSNLLATGFSENQLEGVINNINGAAIKFSDTLKTEGIADGIQETFATGKATGMFGELLERSGVDLEQFNSSLAVAKEFGSETDFVLQSMAKLGLGGVTDKYKEMNPELIANQEATLDMQLALADLATVLTPLVTKVTEFVTKIIEWAEENPELVTTLGILAGVVTVITGAMMILAPIMTVLGVIAAALGVTIGAIALPIGLAIAAIGLLVAAGVFLYKNWDTIKERAGKLKDYILNKFAELTANAIVKFNTLKDGAGVLFTALKSKMTTPIEEAREKIKGIIDKIKGFFTGLKLKFPKISMPKLPKFELTGKFSLSPPSVPKLGVNWNADGGVFNKPTIFNTSAGLQGVGEAGGEAIIPLTAKVLGDIGRGIESTMNKNNQSRGGNLTIQIPLNGQVIAEQTFDVNQLLFGSASKSNAFMNGVRV